MDFSVTVYESNYGIIITFIYVFEEVFDHVNYCVGLKVHIAVILAKKIRVIRNHLVFIEHKATIFSIWPSNTFSLLIKRITILICRCPRLEFLWKKFSANIVILEIFIFWNNHARRICIMTSQRFINYLLVDNRSQSIFFAFNFWLK